MIADAVTLQYQAPAIYIESRLPANYQDNSPLAHIVLKNPSNVDATTGKYEVLHGLSAEFVAHFKKLNVLRSNAALWPDGADAPSSLALTLAQTILQKLQEEKLPPTRIVASVEGGIAICFVEGNKYADMECFNDGTIQGVISDRRNKPNVWEIKQNASEIAQASARIGKFINA